MATIKTRPTGDDVTAFLESVPAATRRAEGHRMRDLMERITGAPAEMWGPSIVGFGHRPYTNTTGTNDWFVVGFSPRKAALTVYGVYDGYATEPDPRFDRLGPHTTGRGCLYLKHLEEVDEAVLSSLIESAWASDAAD
ncbi:MAG: DUF1801 domain-containing protein [Ilumatobacteraceae bacterium]